jgi:hypothetical protein
MVAREVVAVQKVLPADSAGREWCVNIGQFCNGM